MQYRKATEQDLDQIVTLVQDTIKTVYPKYYPKEVVDFFCEHHCRENILNDVKAGVVGVLLVDGEIVGTGCYRDNHITRVYVNPACQKQGFGSYIMQCLEEERRLRGVQCPILRACARGWLRCSAADVVYSAR